MKQPTIDWKQPETCVFEQTPKLEEVWKMLEDVRKCREALRKAGIKCPYISAQPPVDPYTIRRVIKRHWRR